MQTLAPFLITENITLSQEPLANLGWTSAAQRPSSMTWYIKCTIQISQTENNYRVGKLLGGVEIHLCFLFYQLLLHRCSVPHHSRLFPPGTLPSPAALLSASSHFFILYLPVGCTCRRNICFSMVRFHLRCSRAERPIKTLFTAKRQHRGPGRCFNCCWHNFYKVAFLGPQRRSGINNIRRLLLSSH